MIRELDKGMRHFAGLIAHITGTDPTDIPGAGAAGGLGGALLAFMDARLCKGADMVLDTVGFDKMLEDADLVITGEGKIDSQTLTGKLPYIVALRTASRNIPVIGICGRADVRSLPPFNMIVPVTPPDMPLRQAMKPFTASENIISAIAAMLGRGST